MTPHGPDGKAVDMVRSVASAWACEPDRVAAGTRGSGLRLSILQGDEAAGESSGAACEAYHTLCFPLRRYPPEVVLGGRRSAARWVGPGQLCMVAAGRQPWEVNFGPWRSLHVHIPTRLTSDIAQAAGAARPGGAGSHPGRSGAPATP